MKRRQSGRTASRGGKRKRQAHASVVFNRFLRMTYVQWLWHQYRPVAENREVVRKLRPPYLLLANHTSVLDPFFVNSLIPPPVHYVVTDASFRSRLVAFGLSLVGSIPKTKTMSDMDAIKNIMKVRDGGGTIGIFPEGQNTWDGHSLPLLSSTAKLAKVLKIPVVTARVSGAYFSKPRWSKSSRRGRVNVRFDIALTPAELKRKSTDEIDATITRYLHNDEFEYNLKHKVKFIGKDRAEYLELALFMCPSCHSLCTMRSEGHDFFCTSCAHSVRYSVYGTFKGPDLVFETIREWNLWQIEEFRQVVNRYAEEGARRPLLRDVGVRVQVGYRSRPLSAVGTGSLELFGDGIEFKSSDADLVFPLLEIRGPNVQNNEHWEFYYGPDLYRITILDPRGSTYKWHLGLAYLADLARNEPAKIVPSQ